LFIVQLLLGHGFDLTFLAVTLSGIVIHVFNSYYQ
jgi:hypothetical protein